MSLDVMLWVMNEAPTSDPYELLVLYALADGANKDGTGSWPSNRTISLRSRCSERKVRYVLRDLEEKGLIRKGDQSLTSHHRADRRPTVYDVVLPRGAQRAPRSINGGHGSAERGAREGVTRGTVVPPNRPLEPSINRGSVTCLTHMLAAPCRGCAADRLVGETG